MASKQKSLTVLFLNEGCLPNTFTKGSIAGKELRLRAAIDRVNTIHCIARQGKTVADILNDQIGELEEKVVIHHTPSWPYYFAGIPLFFYGLYTGLKHKVDIVEAESPIISGPAAILIGKLLNIQSVVEVRASYDELIKHKVTWIPTNLKRVILDIVMKVILKTSELVIANSTYYQKQIQKKYKVNCVVINPGLQYPPKSTSKKQDKTKLRVGYLGRLEKEKGIDLLIKAILLIEAKNIEPDYEVLIAGEGSEEKTYQKLVQKFNLLDKVSFLGFQQNYNFLSSIDILVNPNRVKHPLEMVNAEAAFMGVPVVCFGNKEIPETVIDQETGIKVTEQSSEALARALIDLMKDSQLRKKLGKAGKALADNNYNFGKQAEKLDSVYEKLFSA